MTSTRTSSLPGSGTSRYSVITSDGATQTTDRFFNNSSVEKPFVDAIIDDSVMVKSGTLKIDWYYRTVACEILEFLEEK
jgi:hypothetical protein